MVRYRVVFKDGSHGAWTSNYEEAKKSAEFFRGRVESRVFKRKDRRK